MIKFDLGGGAGAGAGAGGFSTVSDDPPSSSHGYDYDLVVIGGGSGGLACSKAAAGYGAKVAVLDFVKPSPAGTSWGLGGTCVNVGCIPKKLMHTAAILGEAREDAKAYGWDIDTTKAHSWDKLVDAVSDYISSINFGYRVELREKSVTYKNALGSFVDPHSIECVDKKGKRTTITADKVVIAVGGRPRPLGIPGQEHVISSDDIFQLASEPGKTLCIGASYVSLECAGFLHGLGYDVTVAVRSILLRGFDQEAATAIGDNMKEHGVKFAERSVPVSIEKQSDGKLKVTLKNVESGEETSDVFDTVFTAVGRIAETSGLGLDKAGVIVEANGKIKSETEQTNVEHIYAIGDVLDGRPELTPVAIQAGRLLAARLFNGATKKMDYDLIPTTVFTPLEYGCIGLSEEDAMAKYGDENIETYLTSFQPLEWKLTPHRSKYTCAAKLVCLKTEGERVVGFHILGPNAGEITQGFAVAMRLGATYETFTDTIGIHPTTAEEFTVLEVTRASGVSTDKGGC